MATVTPPRCPTHQVELLPTDDPVWKGRLLVCPVRGCTANEMIPVSKRQMKLPGLDPGRQYKQIRASEAALVKQWLQWGGLKGYTILEIGQKVHYLSCPCCQGKIKTICCPYCQETTPYSLFSQSTPGAPDTFWTHPDWGANTWRGLEAKRDAKAPIREEQARLAALGYVDVVWTLEMVMAALKRRG